MPSLCCLEMMAHGGNQRQLVLCRNDITGAQSAGCHAWLWGSDVKSFEEIAQRLKLQQRALCGALKLGRKYSTSFPNMQFLSQAGPPARG